MNNDTSLPVWLDEIVSIEYSEDLEREQRASVGEYFWEMGNKFDDFDTFYEQVARDWPEEPLNPDHRAHSLENYRQGDPWNCLGRTTFLTALADIGFGKTMDIVLEYTGDWDPEREMVRQNRSHIHLKDRDGTQYGPSATYDSDDEFYRTSQHDPEILPLLYRLSEAHYKAENGNIDEAREITRQVEDSTVSSEYIGRKIAEVKEFGY
ncbi:MAG: hypothetical protein MUP63_02130 [Candidatus Nanohaloarchaeota archaeon QJJ-7]|nr:hypothetical protein [Candidatus Nanohaloarchaeota archaeon QJJ-7]